MSTVRFNRLTATASQHDSSRSARITKRAVELLGRQLALGDAVAPRPKLMLEVTMQPGMTEEQMAQRIARELALKLM